jgi:hypothetical protein
MTHDQLFTVRQLRQQGYAVVIFTPEQIGEADPSHLEDLMVERGNIYLETFLTGEN